MTKIDELCPHATVLAAYIDGTLAADRVEPVTHHLARCAECRRAVENVIDLEEEQEATASHRVPAAGKWVALAAGLILVALAIPAFLSDRKEASRNAMRELTAASPTSFRLIEPRLSAGFHWAPFRGVRRAGPAPKTSEELVATGAAGKVVRELRDDRRPESLHVIGVAYLVAGDSSSAVKMLREAIVRDGGNAALWSDLSAALYVAAEGDDPAEFRLALDAAERAIRLDPKRAEAHFNRAVILEQIGTPRQITDAWGSYLSTFPDGPWASEARERLEQVRRE